MKLLIISHVQHKRHDNDFYAYGPYVREMDIWVRHASDVRIIAPLENVIPDKIDLPFMEREKVSFYHVRAFDFMSLASRLKAPFAICISMFRLLQGMAWADHIHIRCPGNMGLLGLAAQIFFPWKTKTVKYAGNWDDYSGEHKSYRIQKWISRNTLLTHHVFVLVYGKWKNFTKNCVPFFTASYRNEDLFIPVQKKITTDETINALFIGVLDERKRPDLAIEVVQQLREQGIRNIKLNIVGDGPDVSILKALIAKYNLADVVFLRGNISPRDTIQYYQQSHVLIFLSRMEGWPKVVAESMFWGCVPITTAISCVPWMLDYGGRGMLVDRSAPAATSAFKRLIDAPEDYVVLQQNAMAWARAYTLDKFEEEIVKMMKK